MPDWSPVRTFKSYAAWSEPDGAGAKSLHRAAAAGCGCANSCNIHAPARAWGAEIPTSDASSFWGALGCACWAV